MPYFQRVQEIFIDMRRLVMYMCSTHWEGDCGCNFKQGSLATECAEDVRDGTIPERGPAGHPGLRSDTRGTTTHPLHAC